MYNETREFCGIATAAHVVADTDTWLQPMRVIREGGATQFLDAGSRVIYLDTSRDSAVILFPNSLDFPENPIPLLPFGQSLDIGAEVGWLGYPAIIDNTLCFFSGSISARQDFRNAYLIDGVAINGVSGGPVLYVDPVHGVHIVGTVSAYQANKLTGDTLPGLLFAQDVSHFHDITMQVQSIDEANQMKRDYEQSTATEMKSST